MVNLIRDEPSSEGRRQERLLGEDAEGKAPDDETVGDAEASKAVPDETVTDEALPDNPKPEVENSAKDEKDAKLPPEKRKDGFPY